ncbi:hypothetical protein ceV_258 [Chrysochromulina ericina virus CeV-01B]|uniref:Uncharacterized protein n=1 Tax=Chrysochromulina ericina virus CeV-01B TaxID=3070830 RepID=A0A0N9QXC7_9VIRU|nr:hypothetical protein ceV_258 [Chrysochromulina ericina virus]ALH23164.1 hypothetical protein ceV_258 [Chrysochromulina ericina virus CeV-01B]|tara:strand:- start:1057 stop:1476 length:420 start_codon:yes stop_codon:yes gene_type:complete
MDTNDYYYLNLNILSQLEEQDKLGLTNINNNIKLIVDKSSYISSVSRYYNGYNRISVIDYLKDFTNRLEKYIELLVKGNLNDYNETIIPIIENSIKGLENLKKTYSNDSNMVSEISLIVIKFNNFINELNNLIHEDSNS